MRCLIKIIDLILYSNFWIAAAALAMSLQTQYILLDTLQITPLAVFIFSSTLFLYALHRIVGLQKVQPFQDKGRYLVISTFKRHIVIYAILAGLAAFLSFWHLNIKVQLAVVIPAILSLGYVIPILTGKRRFRDVHFIKIFLVAFVWACITVLLAVLEYEIAITSAIVCLFIERSLFVFAITLPFDIRDLKIDAHTAVKTIPSELGILGSKYLAVFLLMLMLLCVLFNWQIGFYSFSTFLALLISAVSSLCLIWYADKVQHDYYFTGLIDGTMLFQFLLVIGLSYLITNPIL